MSNSVLAEFDGYKLRAPEERDREKLREWIAADPAHRDYMTPDFFLGRHEDGSEDSRPTCCVLEDGQGDVLFIRISRAARVNIQFGTTATSEYRERNREALMKGMAFLEGLLAMAGVEEWVFQTKSNLPLAALAKRRMGFVESSGDMVRPIAPLAHTDGRG